MSLGPTFYFAGRILGFRSHGMPTGAKRSRRAWGRRYIRGAILGVALSIVPLVVVLIVADGMIQGITARYIEVGTYHLQAQPLIVVDQETLNTAVLALDKKPGMLAFPEFQGIWAGNSRHKNRGSRCSGGGSCFSSRSRYKSISQN